MPPGRNLLTSLFNMLVFFKPFYFNLNRLLKICWFHKYFVHICYEKFYLILIFSHIVCFYNFVNHFVIVRLAAWGSSGTKPRLNLYIKFQHMPHYSAAKSKLGCYSTLNYLRNDFSVWLILCCKYVEYFSWNMLKC